MQSSSLTSSDRLRSDRPESVQRFTLDGSAELEHRLAELCGQITQAVQGLIPAPQLLGLLLGGGYGRGEGGVLRTGKGDAPYNDLEFYVIVRGNEWLAAQAFARRLHQIAHQLRPQADVELEFKIIKLRKLERSPTTMFSYDMVSGHRWLIGNDDIFSQCAHHRDPARIPLAEATRLLMNRCSGLLFAADQLAQYSFGPGQADFVGRNLAKAQLGLGDVALTVHQQYHWSCLERRDRLQKLSLELPWVGAIRQHHAAGVEFKLHPVRSTEIREALLARHQELTSLARQVWLWLETRRLGTAFDSPLQYGSSPANKCPETKPVKNRLVNLRTFGPTTFLAPSGSRYPRERLLNSLAVLLFEPARLGQRECLRVVQTALQTPVSTWPELVSAYRRLWSRFN